ncbi:hypothetical protein [Nocardioides sp.]|uniref:hypothetical protein n=1 Tax=Nocardioides sp. TaxID=35761 RepID=UPI003568B3FE
MRTPLRASTLALLAAVTTLLGGVGPSAAVPETELKPARIERGDDIRVPHVEDRTIVDGDLRVPVKGRSVTLLGVSGEDYVVVTTHSRRPQHRTVRISPDGQRRLLLRGITVWNQVLADDGSRIAVLHHRRAARTTVAVHDAESGERVGKAAFRGYRDVLDFAEERIALGGNNPGRTVVWDVEAGTRRQVAPRYGYAADLRRNRLATYTGDPYDGGCSVVSTLEKPRRHLWTSCSERVHAFSPSGWRMATIHILADGLGPNEVRLRTIRGKVLARYTTYWFGQVWWESGRDLLLDTNGRRKSAVVRCAIRDCERATDLEETETP